MKALHVKIILLANLSLIPLQSARAIEPRDCGAGDLFVAGDRSFTGNQYTQVLSYLQREWSHMPDSHEQIARFIQDRFLNNEDFVRNPEGFMNSYRRAGGNFDVLNVPEDPALGFMRELRQNGELTSFANDGLARTRRPTTPNSAPAARALSATQTTRVNSFLRRDWSHMQEHHGEIRDFIQNHYLQNPEFQRNPKAYIRAQRANRGFGEMLLIPGDPALNFMEGLVRYDELETFIGQGAANPTRRNPTGSIPDGIAPARDPGFSAPIDPGRISRRNPTGSIPDGIAPPNPTRRNPTGSIPDGIAPATPRNTRPTTGGGSAAPTFYTREQAREVSDYMFDHWDHMRDQHGAIRDHIERAYLNNPEFQRDPGAFIAQKRSDRGFLENLEIPGDPALQFFEGLVRDGRLNQFLGR